MRLTPGQRTFLEAVANGDAYRDTRPPYPSYVTGTSGKVRKTVLDAVLDTLKLARVDHDQTRNFAAPYVLTDAGRSVLTVDQH